MSPLPVMSPDTVEPPAEPGSTRAYVPCGTCAKRLVERTAAFAMETITISKGPGVTAGKVGTGQTIKVPAREMTMDWRLRPADEPCPKCFTMTTYVERKAGAWTRVGEHAETGEGFVYMYNGPDGSWTGNTKEYEAICERVYATLAPAALTLRNVPEPYEGDRYGMPEMQGRDVGQQDDKEEPQAARLQMQGR